QPPADAGPPEDSEQRAVQASRAEAELCVSGHLDIVAHPHLAAERVLEGRSERERPFPVGQVTGASDVAVLDHPGGAHAHPGQLRGLDLSCLGRVSQRDLHLGRSRRIWPSEGSSQTVKAARARASAPGARKNLGSVPASLSLPLRPGPSLRSEREHPWRETLLPSAGTARPGWRTSEHRKGASCLTSTA